MPTNSYSSSASDLQRALQPMWGKRRPAYLRMVPLFWISLLLAILLALGATGLVILTRYPAAALMFAIQETALILCAVFAFRCSRSDEALRQSRVPTTVVTVIFLALNVLNCVDALKDPIDALFMLATSAIAAIMCAVLLRLVWGTSTPLARRVARSDDSSQRTAAVLRTARLNRIRMLTPLRKTIALGILWCTVALAFAALLFTSSSAGAPHDVIDTYVPAIGTLLVATCITTALNLFVRERSDARRTVAKGACALGALAGMTLAASSLLNGNPRASVAPLLMGATCLYLFASNWLGLGDPMPSLRKPKRVRHGWMTPFERAKSSRRIADEVLAESFSASPPTSGDSEEPSATSRPRGPLAHWDALPARRRFAIQFVALLIALGATVALALDPAAQAGPQDGPFFMLNIVAVAIPASLTVVVLASIAIATSGKHCSVATIVVAACAAFVHLLGVSINVLDARFALGGAMMIVAMLTYTFGSFVSIRALDDTFDRKDALRAKVASLRELFALLDVDDYMAEEVLSEPRDASGRLILLETAMPLDIVSPLFEIYYLIIYAHDEPFHRAIWGYRNMLEVHDMFDSILDIELLEDERDLTFMTPPEIFDIVLPRQCDEGKRAIVLSFCTDYYVTAVVPQASLPTLDEKLQRLMPEWHLLADGAKRTMRDGDEGRR